MIVKKRTTRNPANSFKLLQSVIADNVRNRRLGVGLTQKELAEKLRCSQNFICLIELRRKKLSLATLCALADVLDCTYQQLLTPNQFVALPTTKAR